MPRPTSLLRLAALVLLLPALQGCIYFAGAAALGAGLGAASTPRPLPHSSRYRPGAALLVDFAQPRDVAVLAPGERDSTRVAGVRRMIGTLRATRGDTLLVAVTELRDARGTPFGFAARQAPLFTLPPDAPARIHVIASSGAMAQRAVAGGLLGLALSFVLLWGVCYNGCLD